MKLVVLFAIADSASLGALGLFWFNSHGSNSPPRPSEPADITANGVTEGSRPETLVRSEVTGVIRTLAVHENDDVAAGALLIELENSVQQAEVALAEANVATATGECDRVRNGERAEKRKALEAAARSKHAAYLRAQALYESAPSSRAQGPARNSMRSYISTRRKQRPTGKQPRPSTTW